MTHKLESKIVGYSVVTPEDKARAVAAEAAKPVIVEAKPLVRTDVLHGRTYKIKPGDMDALYITINNIEQEDGTLRPFEVFINTKNVEHLQWMTALTRMISAVLRKPGDYLFIVDELKQVFAPKGGYFEPGKGYMDSVVAHIGHVFEQHCKDLGAIKSRSLTDADKAMIAAKTEAADAQGVTNRSKCKVCGDTAVVRLDGCDTCLTCGASKCG